MNVAEVTEVCRLCPTKAIDPNQKLINIFDYTVTEKYNLKDVIFMTTGVEILQNDLVSVKICQRCMNITLKMSQFRGDAQKQDRHLKGRLNEILTEKVLAKTKHAKVIVPKPIAIKIEPEVLHPSITNIYRNNPCLKIPKACIGQHMDPVVSLVKDEAEQYLRKRKLDTTGPSNSKAQPSVEKTVSPLRISKMQCDNRSVETYFCINKSSLPTTSSTTSSNGINNLTPVNLRLPTTSPPADATSSMVRSVEFLQNFDLTPTVKTLKTQEVCVCEHCGSVHNNTFERKRHINRVHTLCQFCKKKFKTVEAKIRHQENGCKVKRIINSPGPIVSLERVELNLDIRKKFKSTFASFEAIPGLFVDDVIILSDDEETLAEQENGHPSSVPLVPECDTVLIVKPNIRIKGDNTLDNLAPGLDNAKLKQLLTERMPPTLTVDTCIQTDFPPTNKIVTNNFEGTCQFGELKDQLTNYNVPVEIENGAFHASYKFHEKPPHRKRPLDPSAMWNHLPLIDVKAKPKQTSLQSDPKVLASQRIFPSDTPVTASTVINSIVVSSSSSAPILVNKLIPCTTSSTGIFAKGSGPITSTTLPIVINSATPLLQTYALSVEPIVSSSLNRPIPFPKKYVLKTKESMPHLVLGNSTSASPSVTNNQVTFIGVCAPNNGTSKVDTVNSVNVSVPPVSTNEFAFSASNSLSSLGFRVKPLSELQ
ncbi:uncharacterized protein LOC126743026 isoform X2 [Anthonomus grandis grandis]|uniref:uncharacterized protein LOC126743026 isoform X2 n=1 Tax=Anthonomus grandis grandis TaxID=2921223 RepID=UPI0021657A05|nr:uncharacterized protein LOC126743026 isoform X2 [Anthonomus grandis grandis]